jgi:hypothetical protein
MMNEQQIILANDHRDGFSDPNYGGARSVIRGSKIKFTNDAHWLADADEVDPEREFLVVQIDRVRQKWLDQRPVVTEVLQPNEAPNIEALNEAAPKEEWRDRFGKPEGPWQFSYVAYLLDPATMGAFTYPTATTGGYLAIDALKDATVRARMLQGANYFPVVTLGHVHMNTAFGGRERPELVIKRFVPIGPAAPALAPKPESKRGDSDAAMKDEIPW